MSIDKSTLKPISLFLAASSTFAAFGFALTYKWTQADLVSYGAGAAAKVLDSNKEQDGLNGPVHRVRTERAKLLVRSGKLVAGPRELLEATTYDLQGNRTDNSYYLVEASLHTGREEYRHDDKGNIVEMTVRDSSSNSILSKEVYKYELDALGNWTQMTTFLVVFEDGRQKLEPSEVTYRNISYYYNQAIADLSKPSSSSEAASTAVEQASDRLRGALDGWIAATNARDIDKLMGFYALTIRTYYRARAVSREFVRTDKARVFQQADLIDVRADVPEIKMDAEGRTATMRFHKKYLIKGGAQDRSGEVVQEMRWQLTAGGWEIISERDVQVVS